MPTSASMVCDLLTIFIAFIKCNVRVPSITFRNSTIVSCYYEQDALSPSPTPTPTTPVPMDIPVPGAIPKDDPEQNLISTTPAIPPLQENILPQIQHQIQDNSTYQPLFNRYDKLTKTPLSDELRARGLPTSAPLTATSVELFTLINLGYSSSSIFPLLPNYTNSGKITCQ